MLCHYLDRHWQKQVVPSSSWCGLLEWNWDGALLALFVKASKDQTPYALAGPGRPFGGSGRKSAPVLLAGLRYLASAGAVAPRERGNSSTLVNLG